MKLNRWLLSAYSVVLIVGPAIAGLAQELPSEVRRAAELSAVLEPRTEFSIPDDIRLAPPPLPKEGAASEPSGRLGSAVPLELYRKQLEGHRQADLELLRLAAEEYRSNLEVLRESGRFPLDGGLTYADGIKLYRDWIRLYRAAMERSYTSPMSRYKLAAVGSVPSDTFDSWFVLDSTNRAKAQILSLSWKEGETLLHAPPDSPRANAARLALKDIQQELAEDFTDQGLFGLADYALSAAPESSGVEHLGLQSEFTAAWAKTSTVASRAARQGDLHVELKVTSQPTGAVFTLIDGRKRHQTLVTDTQRTVPRGFYSYRVEMEGYHVVQNTSFDLIKLTGRVSCVLREMDDDSGPMPCRDE